MDLGTQVFFVLYISSCNFSIFLKFFLKRKEHERQVRGCAGRWAAEGGSERVAGKLPVCGGGGSLVLSPGLVLSVAGAQPPPVSLAILSRFDAEGGRAS